MVDSLRSVHSGYNRRVNIEKLIQTLITLLGLCMAIVVASYPMQAQAQWQQQSCSLPHRIPVTITAVSGTHSTETRIDLSSTDFPIEYAFSSDAADVRVFRADDATAVDFVVAGWDPIARTAVIYTRLPPITSGASELIYIYFGDAALAAADNAPAVFPNVGVRLRSRVSSADPTSAATGLAAFAAATTDVDDSVRPSVTGLNNRSLGGSNGNFGWCVSAVLNVTPATSGIWSFRYGADFGRGGHLYVSGQALEEDWNDDLWWSGNYANTGETLQGDINLTPGWHRYEALGFEGCCDGRVGFQARPPGGAWQDLSSVNFVMRGAQCVNLTATVSTAAPQSCTTDLTMQKTVAVDASSDTEFYIPGSVVRYDIVVENPGQRVDPTTLVLTDAFPGEVAVLVSGAGVFEFTDGAIPSGLGFTYGGPASTTDSVEFSIDGVDFSYTPTDPVDAAITHLRFRPTGALNPSTGTSTPSFTISVLGVLQ
ncbi:MAG: CCXG family PEP-CTERM protein [Woeseiaceae bacterium]